MSTSTSPSPVDDHAGALRSAVRQGAAGLVVLTVAGTVVGALVSGLPGVWGALMGAAVGGGFVLVTALSVLLTVNAPITTMAGVVLGAWLVKVVLLLGLLLVVRDRTFYDPVVFFLVVVVAAVGLLGLETRAVLAARTPYVDPVPSGGGEQD